MNIAVVITTYRRPQDLRRCLEALKQQTRLADEVRVVVRDTDVETWSFLESFDASPLSMQTVTVTIPGAVAALNAGLDAVGSNAAGSDIIAITDDDAAPHPDWLERIEAHFLSDDRIAGVGGRDWLHFKTHVERGQQKTVGRLQWFGLAIGNHHLGIGKAREVDILKGANMSFRQAAIIGRHFDGRMRGSSAQINFEIEFCLALKKAGWKLIYDPMVAVDHYPGQRFDEDKRGEFNSLALTNVVHNETLALLEHLPPLRQAIFLIMVISIGTQTSPGFLQWLRLLPSEGSLASQKFLSSFRGRWEGWQTWRQSKQACRALPDSSLGKLNKLL